MKPSISRAVVFGIFSVLSLLLVGCPDPAATGGGNSTPPQPEQPADNPSAVNPEVEQAQIGAIVAQAYSNLNELAPPEFNIKLVGQAVSGLLSAEENYQRISEGRRPNGEGYWFLDRDRDREAELNFVPGQFFSNSAWPGAEASLLSEFVVIAVSGVIGEFELSYDAYLARYDQPDGSCNIALLDPALPAVGEFLTDEPVNELFPNCMGPVATAAAIIMAAMPDNQLGGYDLKSGTFDTKTPLVNEPIPISTTICRDLYNTDTKKPSTSQVCSDAWFGYGNWVRGGSYRQAVDCTKVGTACKIMSFSVKDDLHSSIRAMGQGRCDCCSDYGASVSGGKNSAGLASQLTGVTGGHVAIAKTIQAHRTSTGNSRSELNLKGDYKGDLDAPAHGATGTGSAAADYKSETTTVTNQAQVGAWNADSVMVHLCQ
ncbi:MAG: hypothetical protein OXT49_03075 [Gammaproteobacteria bacterium]|nr:hypothetical protein [Gammaproteobacteria bacterium]